MIGCFLHNTLESEMKLLNMPLLLLVVGILDSPGQSVCPSFPSKFHYIILIPINGLFRNMVCDFIGMKHTLKEILIAL